MNHCFEIGSLDSKLVRRWKSRLSKKFSTANLSDLRDAFALACILITHGDTPGSVGVFRHIANGDYAEDYGKWLFVFAAKNAVADIMSCRLDYEFEGKKWAQEQRAVGEDNIAKSIRLVVRNCPPPSMGERYDVSAIATVLAYTWYYSGLGFNRVGDILLEELRRDQFVVLAQY